MAALKLSLQPRPLMMRGRGLWKGRSPLRVTSATAVWRLSRELDFFKPSDGPTSFVEEPDGRIQRFVLEERGQPWQNPNQHYISVLHTVVSDQPNQLPRPPRIHQTAKTSSEWSKNIYSSSLTRLLQEVGGLHGLHLHLELYKLSHLTQKCLSYTKWDIVFSFFIPAHSAGTEKGWKSDCIWYLLLL